MGNFDPTWLALREPADRRARAGTLIEQAADYLAAHPDPVVCDLGAGTGSAARGLAPSFPTGVRWVLVDADPECLRVAAATVEGLVETRRADLSDEPDPWPPETTLVTASALFDLASAAWIDRLAARLAEDGLPLLACLTFDGEIVFDPPGPDDALVQADFLHHQRLDKGLGGPACGADASEVLAKCLASRGYRVMTAKTPWRLSAGRDDDLIAALVEGYRERAAASGALSPSIARSWAADRTRSARTLTVGHVDLLAIPPDRPAL